MEYLLNKVHNKIYEKYLKMISFKFEWIHMHNVGMNWTNWRDQIEYNYWDK